jgi:alcohol dehydrogenase class IV
VLGEVEQLSELYARVAFVASFDEADLPPDAQSAMVTAAMANPFKDNNRRPATASQLREILASAGVPATDRLAAAGGMDR